MQQTYRDIEIILLDDASSDNSMEVLERYRPYADVRIVRNEQNSGSTFKQWLKGLEMARADVIWVAESDDSCEADFLECLLPSFENPRVKLAYANSHVMDENSQIVGDYTQGEYLTSLSRTKWAKDYQVSAEQEINDGLGVKNTMLSASAVIFRRFEISEATRASLAQMRLVGDWYFWINAILHGEVCYTATKLNYHRRHSESVIGKLLRQNRVGAFLNEFSNVHKEIFSRYRLAPEFAAKWEEYLQSQWEAFFPGRPFVELREHYPLDKAREQIRAASITGCGLFANESHITHRSIPDGALQESSRQPN
jgi:glycosyltransferase involved in cell wall biosynthesis